MLDLFRLHYIWLYAHTICGVKRILTRLPKVPSPIGCTTSYKLGLTAVQSILYLGVEWVRRVPCAVKTFEMQTLGAQSRVLRGSRPVRLCQQIVFTPQSHFLIWTALGWSCGKNFKACHLRGTGVSTKGCSLQGSECSLQRAGQCRGEKHC